MLKYFLEKDSLFHDVLRILIALLLLISNLAAIYNGALEIINPVTYLSVLQNYDGWRSLFMLVAWPVCWYLFVVWPFLVSLALLLKRDLFSLVKWQFSLSDHQSRSCNSFR